MFMAWCIGIETTWISEVLVVVNVKITVFWDVMPCSLLSVSNFRIGFRGICCLHLKDRFSFQQVPPNVDTYVPNSTTLHPR
jgi:hypothetical protein